MSLLRPSGSTGALHDTVGTRINTGLALGGFPCRSGSFSAAFFTLWSSAKVRSRSRMGRREDELRIPTAVAIVDLTWKCRVSLLGSITLPFVSQNRFATFLAHITHMGDLQTHPLTPIPLLLSARFCVERTGLNEAYATLLPVVTIALQRLRESNGLARMCLQRLGLDCDVRVPSSEAQNASVLNSQNSARIVQPAYYGPRYSMS